jgi:NAD(P)-dependent dehydrogenase (short-subunit alcohol dehydrogenase family)
MTKTALITGVASGIGLATSKFFQQNGWNVIGVDLKNPTDSLEIFKIFIQGDISLPELWQQIATKIDTDSLNLDVIVNNAAIGSFGKPLSQTTPAEWDRMMAVNLSSVYLSVYYLAPKLNPQNGAIVNVSSVHAIATSPNMTAYATTKGALLALTRGLAMELAPIRVNAMVPGEIETPMLYSWIKEPDKVQEWLKDYGKRCILGRVGQPSEIAEAIYFLADGDRSSFMTGQQLVVDGGAIARLSTK